MTYLSNAWMDFSLCRGQNHLFFPSPKIVGKKREQMQNQALELCAKCPVIKPCREYGEATESSGIWGGETEEERAARGLPVSLDAKRRMDRKRRAESSKSL